MKKMVMEGDCIKEMVMKGDGMKTRPWHRTSGVKLDEPAARITSSCSSMAGLLQWPVTSTL